MDVVFAGVWTLRREKAFSHNSSLMLRFQTLGDLLLMIGNSTIKDNLPTEMMQKISNMNSISSRAQVISKTVTRDLKEEGSPKVWGWMALGAASTSTAFLLL